MKVFAVVLLGLIAFASVDSSNAAEDHEDMMVDQEHAASSLVADKLKQVQPSQADDDDDGSRTKKSYTPLQSGKPIYGDQVPLNGYADPKKPGAGAGYGAPIPLKVNFGEPKPSVGGYQESSAYGAPIPLKVNYAGEQGAKKPAQNNQEYAAAKPNSSYGEQAAKKPTYNNQEYGQVSHNAEYGSSVAPKPMHDEYAVPHAPGPYQDNPQPVEHQIDLGRPLYEQSYGAEPLVSYNDYVLPKPKPMLYKPAPVSRPVYKPRPVPYKPQGYPAPPAPGYSAPPVAGYPAPPAAGYPHQGMNLFNQYPTSLDMLGSFHGAYSTSYNTYQEAPSSDACKSSLIGCSPNVQLVDCKGGYGGYGSGFKVGGYGYGGSF